MKEIKKKTKKTGNWKTKWTQVYPQLNQKHLLELWLLQATGSTCASIYEYIINNDRRLIFCTSVKITSNSGLTHSIHKYTKCLESKNAAWAHPPQ